MLYAPRSLSARALLALFLPASRYFIGRRSVHVAPLRAYRPATSAFRLRHAVNNSRVIPGYSLNFP